MNNKKIKYSFLIVFIIMISITACTFNNQKSTYNPQIIKDIAEYKVENNSRYIILYDTLDKRYYLTKIESYGLNKQLLDLGEDPLNFKDNKDGLLTLAASNYHITFYEAEYKKQTDKHNNISELGLVEINGNINDSSIQITHNKRVVGCHIPFEQYTHYIAIDLFQID